MEQLEPQSRVPRAGERTGQLPRRRTTKSTRSTDVGDDLVVSVEEGKYEPHFRFVLPGKPASDKSTAGESNTDEAASATRQRLAPKSPSKPPPPTTSSRQNSKTLTTAAVYEAQLQPLNGPLEHRDFAVNVPTGEGDLALTPATDLTRQLAGVDYQMHDAADMALNSQQLAGFQMGDALLGALIVMLLGEQLLAYMASYHIQPLRSPTR